MKEDADCRVTQQVHSTFFPSKRKAFPSLDMSQATALSYLTIREILSFMGLWQDNQASFSLLKSTQAATLESLQGMQVDGKPLVMVSVLPALQQLLVEEGQCWAEEPL